MGRTVLLAVIGLLALSGTLAEEKKVNSSVIQQQKVADHNSSVNQERGVDSLVKQEQDDVDHVFAESAPRSFIKAVEPKVYASNAPHTSYSYRVYPGPYTASSKIVPVKTARVVVPKALQFDIRDSYGKYVESPQTAAYRPSLPQQFVRLQDLPPHLAQPLVFAASPSFQFRDLPNYFFGPHSYQVQELQPSGSSPENQVGRFSEPLVYAEDIRNLAPQTIVHLPAVLQETKTSPKYQRLKENPDKTVYKSNKENIRLRPQDVKYHTTRELARHLQKGSLTKVPAVVNGNRTVVKVETKPVLPLLDLNLLEPLTFDNPLVPQIQHFLPKIPKIPQDTDDNLPTHNPKKVHKNYTITKTKSYESTPKKKHTKQPEPEITIKGHPNDRDISYEINTPNGKEIYKEKVLKYNKETNSQPVEYSYSEQSTKKPVVYSFVHNSKEPLKVTHVEYNSDDDKPKTLEYNLQSQEEDADRDENTRPSSQESSADSEEYSDESEEEGARAQSYSEEPTQNQQSNYYSQNNEQQRYQEPPKQQQSVTYLLPTQEYKAIGHQVQKQNYASEPEYYMKTQASPPPQPYQFIKTQASPPPRTQYYIKSQAAPSPQPQNIHHNTPNPYQSLNYEITQGRSQTPKQQGSFNAVTIPSHQLKVEHREQQYQRKPSYGAQQDVIQTTPQYFSQPIIVQNPFQTTENIRILSTHIPHAAPIRVDPNQHIQLRPTFQSIIMNASPSPQKSAQQQSSTSTFKPIPQNNPGPNIYGKAKRVFIKENEETPEKKHMHTEQIMAEMIDMNENSEEDFEKSYKEAAFGFPAYKQIEEDAEKEIYNPESYGVTPSEYAFDGAIFNEYQKEGDKSPKSARLTYKKIKDNNQEDYFSDYAIHKPESYADRVKNKVEYYKMFKKHSPHEGNSEKLILSPSFDHFETSSLPRQKVKSNKQFAQYKMTPTVKYEYEYEYEPPKDSKVQASRPYHKYRTQFVEPQFQYGFEPLISAPIVAESELAAVASNHSPESEKPDTRKKLYKEKWYIKKTTTRNKAS